MKAAPDIFVVHGALGSASQMGPVVTALGALGFVQAVELPGHGATALNGADFSISSFVDSLAAAVERRASERRNEALRLRARIDPPLPIVFGYSMGGYVALALEARSACTFASIVTLGTKFLWTADYAAAETKRLEANSIAQKVPAFANELEQRHAGSGGWHLALQNTAQLMNQLGQTPALTREVLSQVRLPVCLAVGERDATVSVQETREVAGWMPNAKAVVLPDVQHPVERVPVAAIVQLMRNAGVD